MRSRLEFTHGSIRGRVIQTPALALALSLVASFPLPGLFVYHVCFNFPFITLADPFEKDSFPLCFLSSFCLMRRRVERAAGVRGESVGRSSGNPSALFSMMWLRVQSL